MAGGSDFGVDAGYAVIVDERLLSDAELTERTHSCVAQLGAAQPPPVPQRSDRPAGG
jgi:hypothetical protein